LEGIGQMVIKILIALLLIASPCFAGTAQIRNVVGMAISIPLTYSMFLTISGVSGADKVTVDAIDYTASDEITGLSSATEALTCTADTGRECECTGTAVTGTVPDYVVDMSDSAESVSCTFQAAGGACDIALFSQTIDNASRALAQYGTEDYIGAVWGGASQTICAVDFKFYPPAGDISGINYVAEVFDSSFNSKGLSPQVSGASLNNTVYKFTFSPAINLISGDTVVVHRFDMSSNESNYAKVARAVGTDSASINSNVWTHGTPWTVNYISTTNDFYMVLYGN